MRWLKKPKSAGEAVAPDPFVAYSGDRPGQCSHLRSSWQNTAVHKPCIFHNVQGPTDGRLESVDDLGQRVAVIGRSVEGAGKKGLLIGRAARQQPGG